MKRWIIFVYFSLSSMTFVFSGNTFSDILTGLSQNNEEGYSQNCPECGYENTGNAEFCAKCGQRLESESEGIECPGCGYENSGEAKFCAKCGDRLEFRHSDHSRNRQRDRDYDRRDKRDYRDRESDNDYRSSDRNRSSERHSGPVSLGSFVKANYDDDIKVYNIAGHTQNQSFSKVRVNVRVTQQWAVIINVIKVQTSGQWSEITVGSRLQNGRNDFSVSIPQGSTQMVIAFNHGQGCEINVSME